MSRTPTASIPPTPLPSSPAPTLPPPRYLPAVPSLLQPLSPPLSALHAARVKLILDLPPDAARKWCCERCGALRDGFGWKVVRVKKDPRVVDVDVSENGGRKNKDLAGDGRKAAKRPAVAASDAYRTNSPAKKPKLDSTSFQPSSTSARSPPAPKNRLSGVCTQCGAKFHLPGSSRTTVDSFPSARRTRRSSMAGRDGVIGGTKKVVSETGVDGGGGDSVVISPERASSAETAPKKTSHTKPQPPDLLRTSPCLAHLPTSHPSASTSPFPSVLPSSLPPSSTISRSASPVGGLPKTATAVTGKNAGATPAGGKRKKKSGLAKLLADSAARKEEEQGGGLGSGLGKAWGLG